MSLPKLLEDSPRWRPGRASNVDVIELRSRGGDLSDCLNEPDQLACNGVSRLVEKADLHCRQAKLTRTMPAAWIRA
jgi:hypothetical protein